MAGFFRIPNEILNPAILLIDGGARIVEKKLVDDLISEGRAIGCEEKNSRTSRGKIKLSRARLIGAYAIRGNSARMSPPHPAKGGFHTSFYVRLIDGMVPREILDEWKKNSLIVEVKLSRKYSPNANALRVRNLRLRCDVTVSALARKIQKQRSWISQREAGFVGMKDDDVNLLVGAIRDITSERGRSADSLVRGARNE